MSNNHKYKIGQKVKHHLNDGVFYIVGISTVELFLRETRLVISREKDDATRNGVLVWPCNVEVIE